MTKSLLDTAGSTIPIVVALEGGYHLDTIDACMVATVLAVLDEPYGNHAPSDLPLTCYWKHRDIVSSDISISQHNDTTALAMRAIRKAARALSNCGLYPWLGGQNASTRILPQPSRHRVNKFRRVVLVRDKPGPCRPRLR